MADEIMVSVADMVEEWLRAHDGYDALAGDGCGCHIDDIMPGECYCQTCVAGHQSAVTAADHDEDGDCLFEGCDVGDVVYRAGRRP